MLNRERDGVVVQVQGRGSFVATDIRKVEVPLEDLKEAKLHYTDASRN